MTEAAEKLIVEHIDLVRKVASRVARKMPNWIEMDELISAGNVGLCEAAMRFQPALHASFAVFAMFRIRGAMIDAYKGRHYPRLLDPIPDAWLCDVEDGDVERRTPPALIAPQASILEELIECEQSVVVSITALRARLCLEANEGRVLDRHLEGGSYKEIGAEEGCDKTTVFHLVKSAKSKMRRSLGVIDGGKKAA